MSGVSGPDCIFVQLDSWSQINGMLVDREYHASASLQGYLYCISSESAERFDPTTGAWSYITPLPVPCENLQAISAKVKIVFWKKIVSKKLILTAWRVLNFKLL